jgi:hypothetical protein
MPLRKQAVLLIHGIGDQHPMDTVRGFADAVTKGTNPGPFILHRTDEPTVFSHQDDHAETFEMRRLSAIVNRSHTDFYEFYWAHLMPQAKWDRIAGWYWVLMKRRISEVPRGLRILWWLSWIALFSAFAAGLAGVWTYLQDGEPAKKAALPLVVTGVASALAARFQSAVGDAAIYLLPKPTNVKTRQKIRQEGVALLEKLNNDYDRVVVVGHSLGSVIGYDILKYAWERSYRSFKPKLNGGERLRSDRTNIAAKALAQSAQKIEPRQFVAEWSKMTRQLWSDYQVDRLQWKVTDFVTIGSPLAYADLLLADNAKNFADQIKRLETFAAPPYLTYGTFLTPTIVPNLTNVKDHYPSHINQASLFAVTCWVNIFSPTRWILKGDLLSGPLAPLFGRGVEDVAVDGGWFFHTRYWSQRDGSVSALGEIREALDLDQKSFRA